MHWFKVADHVNALEFSDNHIAVVEANHKKICIARWKEELFAFSYKCPHAGGILADGYINALGQVVCPLHRYRFDPRNGHNTSGEGYYLKHWPVAVKDDGVYVGMEASGGFFGLFR